MLKRNTYFVKERVAFAKLTDTYDILDPETQAAIGVAKEEPPVWATVLRLLVNKQLMPTRVNVYEDEKAPPVFAITSGWFRHRTHILDASGKVCGSFQSKMFTIGGAFRVLDEHGQQIAEVKGDWKGWNFKFTDTAGRELGLVTKKWGGIGRELFTSADQYVISLNDAAGDHAAARILLLAAGLAIDIVYKESK